MNPHWRSFLESAEGCFDSDSADLIHFGDTVGELLAAKVQTVVSPLTHLALIEVSGEDAKSFLHSQLTNDINHLAGNQVQHAGWCTAKGRMQASFLVWKDGERYLLALSADLLETTQKRLQMYVLRSKVKLASLGETLLILGLSGPQATEALMDSGLPCPTETMTCLFAEDKTVIRIGQERLMVIAHESAMAVLWQKLTVKARPVGLAAWRWLDVQSAFPLVTLATKEEFVPQMADFDRIGGVSFHKGCYPGQEVVARTQYLGKVKRHLHRLNCEQSLKPGDHLYSPDNPDQSCGMVMTVAPSPTGGFEALGVVQSNFASNLRLGSLDGIAVLATAVNPSQPQ